MTAPAAASPRGWTTSPRLSYGARAVLWDIAARGPGFTVTPAQLAARAAADRPDRPEPPAQLAAWLAELAQVGALACHAGHYSLAADREADVLAAKLAGGHLAACRPPLPREEARRHQDHVRELILAGRDPADVEAALAAWRERRARGDRPGIAILAAVLADIEQDWDRLTRRDPADVAVICHDCGAAHRPGDPCPRGGRRW
jgi:hypothetical protein